MLTRHPNIVIALPPKRSHRKRAKAAPILTSRIATALPPKPSPSKPAKAAPILTSRIVDHSKPSPLAEVDHEAAGAAADRLWQEIVQAVKAATPEPVLPGGGKKDQPAPGRKNSRTKSGQ